MKNKPFPFFAMRGTSSATPPQLKRHRVNGTLSSRILRGISTVRRKTATLAENKDGTLSTVITTANGQTAK